MPETWRKIIIGHFRTFLALAVMLLAWPLTPPSLGGLTRAVIAWDAGLIVFLLLAGHLFLTSTAEQMPREAEAQEEGQWTIFWVTTFATAASFAALTHEFSALKKGPGEHSAWRVGLVGGTLVLSWLFAHTMFALRYAHEWYDGDGQGGPRKGLAFPGDEMPDYLDFTYFAMVLGMTFQVSDVQITARRLRRLALLHGLVSFLYSTVIIALTVNIAASLL